jgi:hypothetical protein
VEKEDSSGGLVEIEAVPARCSGAGRGGGISGARSRVENVGGDEDKEAHSGWGGQMDFGARGMSSRRMGYPSPTERCMDGWIGMK